MRAARVVIWTMVGCQQSGSQSVPSQPSRVPLVHRASAAACPQRPSGEQLSPPDPKLAVPPDPNECATDADCTSGRNGRCIRSLHQFHGEVKGAGVACSYDACDRDTDCPRGNACLCGDGENRCVTAGCTSDADCGAYACSPTLAVVPHQTWRSWGDHYVALRCHVSTDECVDDKDCSGGKDCAYSEAKKHWACDLPLVAPD